MWVSCPNYKIAGLNFKLLDNNQFYAQKSPTTGFSASVPHNENKKDNQNIKKLLVAYSSNEVIKPNWLEVVSPPSKHTKKKMTKTQ